MLTTAAPTSTVPPLSDGGTITTALTYMVEQVGNVIDIVVTNPVLCLGLAIWCAGGAIGLFKRLV